MVRKLVTTAVITGTLAGCTALAGIGIGVAGVAQASPASPPTNSPVSTSLVAEPAAAEVPAPASSSALQVEVYKTEAGMSHRQLDYKVTNTSDQAVTVEGAPDVASLFPGRTFPVATGDTYFTKNTPATQITLQPGESAYGEVAWTIGDPTGSTPGELVVSWSDSTVGLDLGSVENFPNDGTYTATNLHAQPVQ